MSSPLQHFRATMEKLKTEKEIQEIAEAIAKRKEEAKAIQEEKEIKENHYKQLRSYIEEEKTPNKCELKDLTIAEKKSFIKMYLDELEGQVDISFQSNTNIANTIPKLMRTKGSEHLDWFITKNNIYISKGMLVAYRIYKKRFRAMRGSAKNEYAYEYKNRYEKIDENFCRNVLCKKN